MRRFLPLVLILCGLPLLCPSSAAACGVLTHGEIVLRASWQFDDPAYPEFDAWLDEYRGALLAGAGFPDWGWICGYTNEAEAAHSANMVETAADYLYATYPQPWDEETIQTAVFLLGFLSHPISDTRFTISRDEPYEYEGFIGVLAHMELNGHTNVAHRFADYGGEAILARQNDLSYLESWYVPTSDMAAVYQQLGYTRVTPEIIELTMRLMYLATLAERALFAELQPLFSYFSTFLQDFYQDFFAGGLDDNALHTAHRWPGLIDRMSGLDADLPPEDDVRHEAPAELLQWVEIAQSLIEAGGLRISVERTARGVVFRSDPWSAESPAPRAEAATASFVLDRPYSYLGTALAVGDFTGDGLADLAIGAPGVGEGVRPQSGRVFVTDGGQSPSGEIDFLQSPPAIELTADVPYGRFGWSLASVDLNRDGRDDLAVSAPTAGAFDDIYHGAVFIYLGEAGRLPESPSITIVSTENRHNLGWRLGAGDLDGDGYRDLLIGSPFAAGGGFERGQALVFLAAQNLAEGVHDFDEAALRLEGENNYDWFGYAIDVAEFGGERFLLVGAPRRRAGNEVGAGRLYAFAADDPGGDPAFTISAGAKYDQLGAAFAGVAPYADGLDYLALAGTAHSSAETQTGAVWLLQPADYAGDLSLADLTPTAVLLGDQKYSRLGWRIGAADVDGDGRRDLLVGQPFRETDDGYESGAAYLLSSGESFPVGEGTLSETEADRTFSGGGGQSRFGGEFAWLDLDNDGCLDLAFGARQSSKKARNAGAVELYLDPACSGDDDDIDDDVDDDVVDDDVDSDDDDMVDDDDVDSDDDDLVDDDSADADIDDFSDKGGDGGCEGCL